MEENNTSLLVFSDEIQIDGNITKEERMLIEAKIYNLLGKWTERYTMGDSTSVPIEVAEELLKSICFSLGLELKKLKDPIKSLMEKDLIDLLKDSWEIIESMIVIGKNLLEDVLKNSSNIGNISYNDTLKEIKSSFKRYDYRFFAHKIECSIDYQLSNPVSESLCGIEYINEYLKSLLIENKFCKAFHRDKIINILNGYCKDYKGLLINIFEPILTNAIGLEILGRDIFKLNISEIEREMLLSIFKGLSKEEIIEELINSSNRVCNTIGIIDKEEIEYIKKSVINIYPIIEVGLLTGDIENIFLSFKNEENFEKDIFIDNELMDNEKLRNLITEIKDCRFISDKVAIVKQEVKSIGDLVEILSECFWGEDSIELFKAFSQEEIYLLKYYLDNKEEYISDSKWEIKLIEYLSNKNN